MDESTQNTVAAGFTGLLGIALMGFGVFRGVDAWLAIEQIQAAGPVGQVVFREEVRTARTGLLMAGGALTSGLFCFILAVTFDVKAELHRLREK